MIIKSKIKINSNYISYIYTHENNSHLALLLHGFGSDMHEKGNFDTYVGTTVDCDDDDIKLSGYLSLSITIFQIIVSVFLGVIYMKKIRSKVYGSKKQSN